MPRELERTLPQLFIRDLALPEPLIVPKGSPLRGAIELMQQTSRPCVLIYDGGRVAGIFTERDILNRLTSGTVGWDGPIDAYMTPSPRTLSLNERVATALELMTREGYRHIPLVDSKGLGAGLLSARDILVYIAEHFPAEVLNLPPRLHQTMKRMDGG